MAPPNSGLPEGTATTRNECRCPDCLSYEGLEEIPAAAKLYDGPLEEILYASKCANDACHRGKIKPEEIKKQIDKTELEESEPLIDFEEFSLVDHLKAPREFIRSTSWKVIGVALLFVISAMFGTLGGFGGGGTVEASDSYADLSSEDGTTATVIYEGKNWTVYRSGNSYIVSGSIDGAVVFLTGNGEVTDSPYRFNNSTAAKEAISFWRARNQQFPSEYEMPDTTTPLINDTNWKVFSYNGSNIVAGKINGKPIFLHPNADYTTDPYFYNLRGVAEQSILYWVALSQTNDLPTIEEISESELRDFLSNWDSDGGKFNTWNNTDLGNWSIYTDGSAYIAATSINNETIYLQPNGTISTSPTHFDTPTAILRELRVWRNNNPDLTPSPITYSPDIGNDWDPIDNQDTIEDDVTSEELTTSEGQSSEADSGALVAGSVKNTKDQPVSGATATLHSNPQTTTTDSNGEFVFTDVPEGGHTIHVAPPENTNLATPRNTSIHVSENGEITAQNDPDNVLYFENDDGTISQNRLTFLAQEKQPIQLNGEGTQMQGTIEVLNPSNINDFQISLIPEYSAAKASTSLSGTDASKEIDITGTTPPENQTLQLYSEIASTQKTISGTYSGGSNPDITIDGNQQPSNTQVTIDPLSYTDAKKWKGGPASDISRTIDAGSTLDPNQGQLTIEGGYYDTTAKSTGTWYSNSGSTSITNDGVKDNSGTLTISPVYDTWQASDSGGGGYLRIYNPGNVQTTAEVTITGKRDWVTMYSAGASNSGGGSSSSSTTVKQSGSYKLKLKAACKSQWSCSGRADTQGSVSKSVYVSTGSGSKVSKSKSFNVHFSSGDTLRARAYDFGDTGEDWANAKARAKQRHNTGRVTISNSNNWARTDYLWGGHTDTVTLTLSPGDNYFSVSTSEPLDDFDWETTFTAKSVPLDVSIQEDGDTIFHQNGPLQNEKTIDLNNIQQGSNTLSYSYNAMRDPDCWYNCAGEGSNPMLSFDASWTETYGPDSPSASLNGYTIFDHDGIYTSSKTISIPGEYINAEENNLDIQTNSGSVDYTLSIDRRYSATDPNISIGETTIFSHTGALTSSKTASIPSSELDPGSNTVDFDLSDGEYDYTIDYTANALPEQATVQIGSKTYSWPDDFNGSGTIPDSNTDNPPRINITELDLGQNDISISTDPVDGMETKAKATVVYDSETKLTTQPEIIVEAPDGTKHTKKVPDSLLENKKLVSTYNMTIPTNWLGTGDNEIIVQTADGSVVSAEVTTAGLKYQNKSLDPSS